MGCIWTSLFRKVKSMAESSRDGRHSKTEKSLDRRSFMAVFTGAGLGSTLLPGVLWAKAQEQDAVTVKMLEEAEKIAGLSFTDEEREMMVAGLNRNRQAYDRLRSVEIPNEVPPAVQFNPVLARMDVPEEVRPFRMSRDPRLTRPDNLEEVAFWPVTKLSELVRSRQVSSTELTEMYLERLRAHGPTLECVITLTEGLAREQAKRADEEIAVGRYRGPLHGIPWGAKDLLATRGHPTTWGAKAYEDQTFDEDATVVRRLEEAGAVLVAKLTLGALAMGDVWYGGRTKNPWNLEQGSSGSSAGSAAATAAGLVGFSIGTETQGSIVSPATRCGASGLRPTFGRVSRFGAMALSWSMDKIGPLCRSAEDCALVLDAIHGEDGLDTSARTVPFNWDANRDLSEIRVGYLEDAFGSERNSGERNDPDFDGEALAVIRSLGIDPIPVSLPDQYPMGGLGIILAAEATAAFDALTRSDRDDLLVRQDPGAWPNYFRTGRMIPAVEYIQANRVRTMVMGALEANLEGVDVFITPSFAGSLLQMTNLTGHPVAVVPSGFRENGTPVSISFVGRLWNDEACLRLAKAYQEATDHHLQRPPLFT